MPIHEYWHEFEPVTLMLITGTMMQNEVLCLLTCSYHTAMKSVDIQSHTKINVLFDIGYERMLEE